MKNLIQIREDVDVTSMLKELAANPDLWNIYNGRTRDAHSPHANIADIWLRFADKNRYPANAHNEMSEPHESVWYEAIDRLPSVKAFIMQLAGTLQAERLGGVIITRLPPGATITPHIDDDWHSKYYKKFHLVLQGEGSLIYSGSEHLVPQIGEVFYLNDKEIHGVVNLSKEDRIALVVCVRQDSGFRVEKL